MARKLTYSAVLRPILGGGGRTTSFSVGSLESGLWTGEARAMQYAKCAGDRLLSNVYSKQQ